MGAIDDIGQGSATVFSELDPKSFWQAIGNRAIGVSVVTASGSSGPAGFLGLSASHLTASPPLLSVSIDLRTSALGPIRNSGAFAVNYLSQAGAEIYSRFSARDGATGAARFEGLAWNTLVTGSPVFRDVVGTLDCRLEELIERHGIVIAIGRIVSVLNNPEARPLVYFRGAVGSLAEKAPGA